MKKKEERLIKDISERKRVEEELYQSIQKWEAIISNSPDGIGMASKDGKLQLISDRLAEIYGYSKKEKDGLLGKPIFEFIDSADHEIFISNMQKLLAGKRHHKISEYQAIKKDKSRFYIDVSSSVLFDPEGNPVSILFIQRDITRRKQAEEALNKSEEHNRLLLENGNDAIFIHEINENGYPEHFSIVNKKASKILGYKHEELLKKTPADIDAPEMIDKINDNISKLIANGHHVFESIQVAKDGRRITVEINGHCFYLDGHKTVMAIARDITESNGKYCRY